jgi:hypothetical protein
MIRPAVWNIAAEQKYWALQLVYADSTYFTMNDVVLKPLAPMPPFIESPKQQKIKQY